MNEPGTLGSYLRHERERRGLTLKTISESTKVSVALLEGLEADNISRWPGGIFRRAFVRAYAQCVGLNADDVVRRFEQQHLPPEPELPAADSVPAQERPTHRGGDGAARETVFVGAPSSRARLMGTCADLTVALVLAFGSAAAGSRLLWPVLLIATYYAVGILLTGTSPMVALLGGTRVSTSTPSPLPTSEASAARRQPERRPQHRRTNERHRHRRGAHVRA